MSNTSPNGAAHQDHSAQKFEFQTCENGRSVESPARPARPQLFPENIPEELRGREQFVDWRYELRTDNDGSPKWTKVPYQVKAGRTTRPAKTTDANTWGSFREAVARLDDTNDPRSMFDGVGYVFAPFDPYFGVDLDHCLTADCEVLEWAIPYLEMLQGTYGEISPSGTGIKFWGRGILPDGKGTKRGGFGPDGKGAIEIYDRSRYFTVTGDRWGKSSEIAERGDVAVKILAAVKARPGRKARSNGRAHSSAAAGGVHSDDEVLWAAAHARGFDALWRGDVSGYASASDADATLTNYLAWAAGPGQDAQVKRLFLASGLGQRKKIQERSDYLADRVVNLAYSGRGPTDYFEWPPPAKRNGHSNGHTHAPIPGPSSNGHAVGDPLTSILAACNNTDMGNADRLVTRHGRLIRYCHPWSKWLVWDGRRWAIDNTAAVNRLAMETVKLIPAEAGFLGDKKEKLDRIKWHIVSEGRERLNAMLGVAAAWKGVPILPEEMDKDGWLFNCANGTIDLRTATLRPHRQEDMITQLCPAEFDPSAKCPLWDSTLNYFLGGDADLIDYWQRLCGYFLVGTVRDHIMPIAYGDGSNGKSTILGTLLEVFGKHYAMKCPPDMLMAKKQDAHPTDRTDLFRKRLVVAIETESGRRLNETMVKELTGGDTIRARRMREDFWEFSPTHTLVMATNHKPVIRGTDRGIWRRLKLVPFTKVMSDDKAIKDMPEKLRAEFPGILAWCVRGCLDWQRQGLKEPKSVTDATDAYQTEQDRLSAFLEEHALGPNPKFKTRARELYLRYHDWCESAGEFPLSEVLFSAEMKKRGYETTTSNGKWYLYLGLRPLAPDEKKPKKK